LRLEAYRRGTSNLGSLHAKFGFRENLARGDRGVVVFDQAGLKNTVKRHAYNYLIKAP
jgi:hypothetical protein